MNEQWMDSVNKLYCALELERSAVGVKLLRTEEEYKNAEAISLKKPINYCQMVAAATKGNCIKAKKGDFKCKSGERVLGIDPADLKNSHGENWARLGLYQDAEVAGTVRKELVYLTAPCYGVVLAPIEKMKDLPDVVILVVNPYNSMRLIQGYAYSYGMPKSINMIGNQAICLECTARPIGVNDMNISMLCIGTRHRAGWKDDEMALGVPGEQFVNVVNGIMSTLNQMENDSNKKIIEQKFQKKKIPFEIRYGYNYYMDC
ncbi:MAG: DUF169 domain-containing protein [Ruminococcus sp.]|nr:DUF169 domain-containing protein [Ruminococcus sp.]